MTAASRSFVAPPEEGAKPQRQLRVLVADDDRDTVLTLMMLLQDEGHDVRGVYSGAQVMDAVRKFRADAVLLDIGMPDLTGFDVARSLRRRFGGRVMIIAVTAYRSTTDKMMAMAAGFDHHIAKPYDPQMLAALLNERRAELAPDE